MSLNKVMLIGNVGNDPEVRYLESTNPGNNAKVASFRLATTERFRDRNNELRENTEWHNIVVWRGNAEVVEKYVHKGSQLYIEGKLRTRQWNDQSGNKRYTTEVVADTLQLLGKRPDGQQDGAQQGYQGGYAPQQPVAQQSGQPYAQAPAYSQAPAQGAYGPAPAQPGIGPAPAQGAYGQAAPQAPSDDLPF